MKRKRVVYSIIALVCACTALVAEAEDKSGVAPATVSLPSGPGSIEGLGASFQPMLNTGSARYSVPIVVPRGTNGNTPALQFQYDSSKGDGPLGIGWSFGIGGIQRQVDKGIPRYVDGPNAIDDDHDGVIDEADELDTFLGPDGEELVQIDSSIFRARIEGSFVRYRRVGEYWEADLPSGTTLQFGVTADARESDGGGGKIFQWLLQKRRDPNGNEIEFHYGELPGSDNKKYLREIRYGPGSSPWTTFYFIRVNYEQKSDWRKDYLAGFLRKTTHRISSVDIGIQGASPQQCLAGDWNEDSVPDHLTGRYRLSYTTENTISSQLEKVTRYGSDGASYLPPVTFAYSGVPVSRQLSAAGRVIGASNAPLTVMDSPLVDLVDLNRDGLPDILKTDLYGSQHLAYKNLGLDQAGGTVVSWSSGQTVTAADGLAQQIHLDEQRANLADMDGDGSADLVHTTVAGDVYFYLNNGNFTWDMRQQMSLGDTTPPPPYSSKDITTADMDFNKKIDVVQSRDGGYSIWFNQEDGKYSREVNTPGAVRDGNVVLLSSPGVQTADVNGDRLQDVAQVTPSAVYYNANMGSGYFADSVEMTIPDQLLTAGDDGQVERAKLTDINGDGLADLVVERAAANELWFWLNLGTDSFSNRHVVTDMPSISGVDGVQRWADINGNGTTDLIYADSAAAERLQAIDLGELLTGAAHPNLLRQIDNGLGVRTEISYQSSTQSYLKAEIDGSPWQTTIPFPLQVVSQVSVSTGLDLDTTPGEDSYVKEFSYRDGFYEDREKQFRGFAEVKVVERGDVSSPTGVTIHEFFTGGPDGVDNDGDSSIDEVSAEMHREEDALKGLVKSVQKQTEDGLIFSRDENFWQVRTLLTGITGTEMRFAYNSRKENSSYEKTLSPETIRTTYVYDDFGNITEERNFGSLAISGDEVFGFSEYINDTTNWLLGLPQRNLTTDGSLVKAAESFNYYDGDPYVGLPLGQAQSGRLTRQEQWVSGTTYIETARNQFDSYGNVVSTLSPTGGLRTITWDESLKSFPLQEVIGVGGGAADLTVSASYNPGLGVVTASTDFNGSQTFYGYDVFGRLTSIILPGDTVSLPTRMFAYSMADPVNNLLYSYDAQGALSLTSSTVGVSSVMTRLREQSGASGTLDSISYVDGLGRGLTTISEAEQGYSVTGAVLFNTKGAVRYAFQPYSSSDTLYNIPSLVLPYSESVYDAVGRVVETFNAPDENGAITSSLTAFAPLGKTVTDENGKAKSGVYDGLGRLTLLRENNLGDDIITRYTYDTMGKLTRIEDAQNNHKTMAYDGMGRKTSMEDPDKGHMAYIYDDSGNLIQTTDNKAQVTSYSYDDANRLLEVDYLDGAGITPDVAYHYDQPAAPYANARNLAGRVAWIEDLSGAAYYSYDDRGNSEWQITRIEDGTSAIDYQSLSEFDGMGRLTATVYPDGDRLQFTYNDGGKLESIPGFVTNIDYTPSGQRAVFSLANGVESSYSYDPRLRLIDMVTEDVPAANILQNLSYDFDGRGNILEIVDSRVLPAGTAANGSQSFGYDDLYRLTSAQGSGYGSISYQYDNIGNLTFKSSPASPDPDHIDDPLINLGVISYGGTAGSSGRGPGLTGGQPGPHAVTSTASGLTYTYDDNGNMTGRGADSYEWDFTDRLTRVTASASVSDFVYDRSGKRKIKKVTEGDRTTTDYYVTPAFEIRDGEPIKYVFDGARRIARFTGRTTSAGESASQMIDLETGWNYIGLNIEPVSTAVTDCLALIMSGVEEVWGFDAATQSYRGYVPSEGISSLTELHAGSGYLIKMSEPWLLHIPGARPSGTINLSPGWNLISSPGDSYRPVADSLSEVSGQLIELWGNDGGTWRVFKPDVPAFLNDLTELQPGRAYWLKMNQGGQLSFSQLPREVRFYHTDHLGSSALVTDINGSVVEETHYYPFGRPRYQQNSDFDSAYKFTGKELDKATGLMYFEARYYDPVVSRFISVDPLYAEVGSNGGVLSDKYLTNSQLGNLYSYTRNNPANLIDPTGLDSQTMEEVLREKARLMERQTVLAEATARQQKKATGSLHNFGDKWRDYGKEMGRRTGLEQTPAMLQANSIALGSGEMAGSPTKKGPTKYRYGKNHHSINNNLNTDLVNAAGSLIGLERVQSAKNNTAEEAALARNSAGPAYQMQKLEDERVAKANLESATDTFQADHELLKGYQADLAETESQLSAMPNQIIKTPGGFMTVDSTGEVVVWNEEGSSGYILNPDGSSGGLVIH